MQIVLISGKMGSGKTTLSNELVRQLQMRPSSRAIVEKFAGPLYRMHDFCLGLLAEAGIKRDIKKDGTLLQLLGTEWGRKTVDENIWVKMVTSGINKTGERTDPACKNLYVIIDDCRFKNELDGFPEALRVRLECNRDVRKARCEAWRDNELHPSEIDLDDWVYCPGKFDMIFDSSIDTAEHVATLICAQLDKNTWLEKRK